MINPIKKYNYSNLIDDQDQFTAIKLIDHLFESDNYCKSVPSFQTWSNLIDYPELVKFKYSFLLSVISYLGKEPKNMNCHGWCYMDFYDNWKLKDRDDNWHQHIYENKTVLTSIYYLSNPNPPALSGTEFMDPHIQNIIPEPFTWFVYPGSLMHRPGIIQSNERRYSLVADLMYES